MTRILLPIVLITATVSSLYAQTASGRFVGTILDSKGGHIVGATVSVANQKTGEERTVKTDSSGNYVVTQLLPSTYILRAASTGLSTGEVTGFVLGVGQEIRQDFTLQVAGAKWPNCL
jgi:hypothetical protein